MTYETCLNHIERLESMMQNKPAEVESQSLLERADLVMQELADTFRPTVLNFGILPRHLNDIHTRLVTLETELRVNYFKTESADSEYEHVIADFYMHFNDVLGIIGSAMDTKGIDYDEPHVLTPKGLVPLSG